MTAGNGMSALGGLDLGPQAAKMPEEPFHEDWSTEAEPGSVAGAGADRTWPGRFPLARSGRWSRGRRGRDRVVSQARHSADHCNLVESGLRIVSEVLAEAAIPVSSANIRARLARGAETPELPPAVFEYIRFLGLYGDPLSKR